MTQPNPTTGPGTLLGIPLGDLGWFSSLLMGVAAGFATFFATTFVSIFVFLTYNSTHQHQLDYALTYRRAGLPAGVVVMALSLAYLGTQWARRKLRHD